MENNNKKVLTASIILGISCLIGFNTLVYSSNPAPVVAITSPTDGSEIAREEIITVVVTFGSDETGQQNVKTIKLEIDGAVHSTYENQANLKQGTCQFTVDTGTLGVGDHIIKAIAIMAQEGTGHESSATIRIIEIQATPVSILGRVEYNYSKIQDISRDVTDTSQIGSQPAVEKTYRVIQKSPDKQKTILADGTEVITTGDVLSIKEPNKPIQTIDIRDYTAETTATEFNYTYNKDLFLSKHNAVVKQDLGNRQYVLEVTPVSEEGLYSKMELTIDAMKGVEIGSKDYDMTGRLISSTEALEVQKIGEAYVPVKEKNTLYLDQGNIVTTTQWNNIQLNTGVSDSEFVP